LVVVFVSVGINLIVILFIYLNLTKQIHNTKSYDYIIEQIRRDVEELVVEINQTTDRNISLVEDRINTIKTLLTQVDSRIKLLDRENGKPKNIIPRYTNLQKTILSDVTKIRNDQKVSKREQVIELSKKGFTSGIIASKVGVSIGEVELIISLTSGKEERRL